ncbi:hypothetical protein FUT87_01545 [Mitsuaria sp. TWR114]|uniref:hypothetical protein n=1 Tax=Mitsuaria sp. TWR114 TaxID=2601731 RepID=UPI0011BD6794|nr:hypothetical protein [Mitsuaria sp. TWR114]TXD99919.1 hypothetical protein FUT87_01545 [Mitsuaria sp. TWR114]
MIARLQPAEDAGDAARHAVDLGRIGLRHHRDAEMPLARGKFVDFEFDRRGRHGADDGRPTQQFCDGADRHAPDTPDGHSRHASVIDAPSCHHGTAIE